MVDVHEQTTNLVYIVEHVHTKFSCLRLSNDTPQVDLFLLSSKTRSRVYCLIDALGRAANS